MDIQNNQEGGYNTMLAVRGHFDGKFIQFLEPIPEREPADVIVVFIDNTSKSLKAKKSQEVRKILRGCEKGERNSDFGFRNYPTYPPLPLHPPLPLRRRGGEGKAGASF
jgi:hypothetical protein